MKKFNDDIAKRIGDSGLFMYIDNKKKSRFARLKMLKFWEIDDRNDGLLFAETRNITLFYPFDTSTTVFTPHFQTTTINTAGTVDTFSDTTTGSIRM